jgi:ABC-type hemin transport system substrate-binding protein
VFARYWRQGLTVSAAGAETAVDTLVQVAGTAIEKAEGLQQRRAG